MIITRKKLARVALFVCVAVVLYNVFALSIGGSGVPSLLSLLVTKYPSRENLENRSLNDEQCSATFPGLTKEIDDAVARGPFKLDKAPQDYQGLVQGRIKDGHVR